MTQNANAGDTELHLKDDISDWNIGDEIGIATTRRGDSTRHRITEINGQILTIDPPLENEHWGGYRDLPGGYNLEMAAEVVNMERNILVHGPDEDSFGDVNHSQIGNLVDSIYEPSEVEFSLDCSLDPWFSLRVASTSELSMLTSRMIPFSMFDMFVFRIVAKIMSWDDIASTFI